MIMSPCLPTVEIPTITQTGLKELTARQYLQDIESRLRIMDEGVIRSLKGPHNMIAPGELHAELFLIRYNLKKLSEKLDINLQELNDGPPV